MDKLGMKSTDIVENNIDRIAEMFPNCIVESERGRTIDFDLLKQELSKDIVEGQKEKYQLNWPGKKEAIVMANTPTTNTLRPLRDKSVDFDNTQNVYIEGDNLEALKILQESYLGKIKCIYIDPPYNTGNDFVYDDNFYKKTKEELLDSGVIDESGNVLITELINTEANGRFHSSWLSMIYPRLKICRNLLKDDGLIFISIDDKELFNLKKICDEVFGENNYINSISVNAKVSAGASGGGEDKRLKKNIEYLLVYTKKFDSIEMLPSIYKNTELMTYIDRMKMDNKSFKYTTVLYKMDKIKEIMTIKDGFGDDIKISKVNDYEIKSVKQVADIENISEEEVYYKYYDKIMTTTNAQTSIRQRVWDATVDDDGMFIASFISKSGKNKGNETKYIFTGKQKVLVIWLKDTTTIINKKIYKQEKIGTLWDGFSWINVTKEGNIRFENGKKPIDFIKQMIQLSDCNNDDIVMDFFSGSGSTAHAVMDYNQTNNTNIRYIMVQIKEKITDANYLEYLKEEKIKDTSISGVAEERIRRAGKKIKEETNADIDYGFRVYKIDSSNMKDVFYKPNEINQKQMDIFTSNIKEDRTPEDILTQIILDWGLTLDLHIEEKTIKGNKIFYVAENSLVACLDEKINIDIIDEIAKCEPVRVVFRDEAFDKDSDKINAYERLKKLSPKTEVKVI